LPEAAVTYAPAVGPAFGVFGRTVRRHWPLILGLTVIYLLAQLGLRLSWLAIPAAPGALAITLKALSILAGGALTALLVALFTLVALAANDQRPLVFGELLTKSASAFPALAVSVLLHNGLSVFTTLWRETAITGTGDVPRIGLAVLMVSLAGALWALIAEWLVGMAVPIRVDRGHALWPTLRASVELAVRRWRPVGGFLLITYLAGFAVAFVLTLRFFWFTPENGQWMAPKELWDLPGRVIGVAALLYWSALYVVLREQDSVAETFD
jgi:hypothetical protein